METEVKAFMHSLYNLADKTPKLSLRGTSIG